MAYTPQDTIRWRVPWFGSLFSRPLIFANAGCQSTSSACSLIRFAGEISVSRIETPAPSSMQPAINFQGSQTTYGPVRLYQRRYCPTFLIPPE